MTRRVAFVLGNLGRGGSETQAVELARRLPDHGWEPVFLLTDRIGEQIETVRSLGLRVHFLGAEHWRPKSSPGFWWNCVRVMRRIQTVCRAERCVLAQSFMFWESALTVPAARFCPGVRGVITCRQAMGTAKDERPWYRMVDRFINPMTDVVICNSVAVARDTIRREGIPRGRIRVIPGGVEFERFALARPANPAGQFPALAGADLLVGCVANLRAIKRVDVLLRAVARARQSIPSLKLCVVGEDRGERAALERLAAELSIADAVAFAGGISDPAPLTAAFDIAALTSDHEGMPNVLLEAMSAGKPVVATSVGGVPEVVRDGRTGLLCPRGGVEAIAAALVRLAGDRSLRHRMGRAGQSCARRHFSMEALTRAHAEIYERLAGPEST